MMISWEMVTQCYVRMMKLHAIAKRRPMQYGHKLASTLATKTSRHWWTAEKVPLYTSEKYLTNNCIFDMWLSSIAAKHIFLCPDFWRSQNGQHFANDIANFIFLHVNVRTLILLIKMYFQGPYSLKTCPTLSSEHKPLTASVTKYVNLGI